MAFLLRALYRQENLRTFLISGQMIDVAHLRGSLAATKEWNLNRLFVVVIVLAGVLVSSCDKSDLPTEPQSFSTFWEYEDPEASGVDQDSIELAVQRASSSPSFYALLVIRDEKILLERYFQGRDEGTLFHLRSITKNVTSAITGMAFEDGILNDVDDPVGMYLDDFMDEDKSKITLRHLLNMTSGLQWNEDAEVLPLIQYRYQDPVKTMSERSVVSEPGTEFNYNSVSPHIVSHILSSEAEQNFLSLAHEMLLDPLEIKESDWELDPQGEAWGGFGLQLRAQDLAKFGLLYLNKGVWEGQQLVPRAWVEESMEPQVFFNDAGTRGYCYQWWTATNAGGLFYGLGYGGQALMIIPEKNMIVVACQTHAVSSDDHIKQWRLFADEIFLPIFRGTE